MHRFIKWLLISLTSVPGFLLLVVGFLIIFRIILIKQTVAETKITSESGIERLESIELGGSKQWILLRGQDVDNPVLLFLHGGPGGADILYPKKYESELEKHFTVVHWDQRGSGKSYDAKLSAESMTLDQMIQDTRDLVEYLKEKLDKDRVFLLGHSWGSILGLETVHRYPDLFYAYFGVSQVVNWSHGNNIGYEFALEHAQKTRDQKAIKALTELGPPPYARFAEGLGVKQQYVGKAGGVVYIPEGGAPIDPIRIAAAILSSPYYSLSDLLNYYNGFLFCGNALIDEILEVRFEETIQEIKVPVYFLHGRHDMHVPGFPAELYLMDLRAPEKEMIWFEESAALPFLEEAGKFQKAIIEHARQHARD